MSLEKKRETFLYVTKKFVIESHTFGWDCVSHIRSITWYWNASVHTIGKEILTEKSNKPKKKEEESLQQNNINVCAVKSELVAWMVCEKRTGFV